MSRGREYQHVLVRRRGLLIQCVPTPEGVQARLLDWPEDNGPLTREEAEAMFQREMAHALAAEIHVRAVAPMGAECNPPEPVEDPLLSHIRECHREILDQAGLAKAENED